MDEISPVIREKAPLILAEIKKAKSVLLHCHPSPDPDSVGSALAMKFVLEGLGKDATVIKGDSEIPQAFMHFPGAKEIVNTNFFETDLSKFDLFIILDSAAKYMVSRRGTIEFPPGLATVVIDHHKTNDITGTGVSLVEPSYPSACQVLYDLFAEWKISITSDIAKNLFIGMYCDTGGFKYDGTTARTYSVAAALAKLIPSVPKLVSPVENSETAAALRFMGIALSSVETFLDGKFAISGVSFDTLKRNGINDEDVSLSEVSSWMRKVADWKIVASAVELEPNKVKLSFRTQNADLYDVSKIAAALKGGGHRAAAGALLSSSLEEAKKTVVAKVKELYNL